MGEIPVTLQQLASRLDLLERRIEALEDAAAPAAQPAPREVAPVPSAAAAGDLSLGQTGTLFSVLGRAMLGIAGAYVLRAIAESSPLPRFGVAVFACLYAILWLVWAARLESSRWLASIIYACTSALILTPMLWELTLRFKVFSPASAAGVLAFFAVAASLLAWKRNLAAIFWVANLTACAVALALSAATHDLLPFDATLLLMTILCEAAAGRDHELSIRPVVAMVTDAAIWALIFIYAGPPESRASYAPLSAPELLAPAILLFLISAAGIGYKTVLRRGRITLFESVQALVSFVLAAASLLYFAPGSGAAVLALLCLILAAACYAAVFTLFREAAGQRNLAIFAAWSVGLVLAGSWLAAPPAWLTAWLSAACVAATLLGIYLGRFALSAQGPIYLGAASVAAGLPAYVLGAVGGRVTPAPAWDVALVAACAVACSVAVKSGTGSRRLVLLFHAGLAVCAMAALLIHGLLDLLAHRMVPAAPQIAFIRTFVLCALALATAFGGARWQRIELNWIAYALLVFVAAKLLFEDMRHGQLEFIAASIFVFAVTLIAVPRLARAGQNNASPA